MPFELDYDRLIHLDSENLAETGIGEAYASLLPELRQYVPQPAEVVEIIDNDVGRYSVQCGGREYPIYGPDLSEEGGGAWSRASIAFFTIVNEQLAGSEVRFYAINGGNDLAGMFLTPEQALASRATMPNPTDWPYLPTDEPPWNGMHHRRRPWWRLW